MGVSSIGISAVGVSSVAIPADVAANVATIAQNSNILIYGFIPLGIAVFIVWQLLKFVNNKFFSV